MKAAVSESNSTTTRIVVLISGNGSNLQALIDEIHQKQRCGQIVAVISNVTDAFGLERAKQANIPTHCISHREFADRASFDAELSAAIDRFNPGLLVLAGFMRILTPAFVNHYKGRMLNIHPSLLPGYQGLNTHQRVIEAGDKVHGASVHFVTEELDGGPCVLQAEVPVLESDDAVNLVARINAQEHLIYPQAVRWYCEGRLRLGDDMVYLDAKPLPVGGIRIHNAMVPD